MDKEEETTAAAVITGGTMTSETTTPPPPPLTIKPETRTLSSSSPSSATSTTTTTTTASSSSSSSPISDYYPCTLSSTAYEQREAEATSQKKHFIGQVFGGQLGQLALMFGVVAALTLITSVNTFIEQHPAILHIPSVFVFFYFTFIACSDELEKQTPLNFIAMGFFTICQGSLLGVISVLEFAENKEMLLVVGICGFVGLSLTLWTFLRPLNDFAYPRRYYDYYAVVWAVVFYAWCLSTHITQNKIYTLNNTGACIIAGLYSTYLVYDMQKSISSNMYIYGYETYMFESLNLYIDAYKIGLYIREFIIRCRHKGTTLLIEEKKKKGD